MSSLYAPEYPLRYHGPTEDCGLMFDDWCRIVASYPAGSTVNGFTFIGPRVEVEVYPENDRYVLPERYLSPRK